MLPPLILSVDYTKSEYGKIRDLIEGVSARKFLLGGDHPRYITPEQYLKEIQETLDYNPIRLVRLLNTRFSIKIKQLTDEKHISEHATNEDNDLRLLTIQRAKASQILTFKAFIRGEGLIPERKKMLLIDMFVERMLNDMTAEIEYFNDLGIISDELAEQQKAKKLKAIMNAKKDMFEFFGCNVSNYDNGSIRIQLIDGGEYASMDETGFLYLEGKEKTEEEAMDCNITFSNFVDNIPQKFEARSIPEFIEITDREKNGERFRGFLGDEKLEHDFLRPQRFRDPLGTDLWG